jgi:hypothetical protein
VVRVGILCWFIGIGVGKRLCFCSFTLSACGCVLCDDGMRAVFWLVGWLQFPSKEDEPRERNLRDDGVYDEVLCG